LVIIKIKYFEQQSCIYIIYNRSSSEYNDGEDNEDNKNDNTLLLGASVFHIQYNYVAKDFSVPGKAERTHTIEYIFQVQFE